MARDTNNSMPHFIVNQTVRLLEHVVKPKVAILGVTYKGNIDDMRESPAQEIIELLQEKGYEVRIHDDHVGADYMISLEESLKGAHMALILTDHNEFKLMNTQLFKSQMVSPIVFDTKNVVQNKSEFTDNGLMYMNMGNLYKGVDELSKSNIPV